MSEYEIGLYRIIGNMLRDARLAKDLTLDQVAERLNLTPKTLQRYEKGERKIKISTIIEISKILNFDYDTFMAEAKARLAGDHNFSSNYYELHEPEPYMLNESTSYYLNEETRSIAQEIFDNKDLRILFDASRKAKPEDLKLIIEMAKRFKNN